MAAVYICEIVENKKLADVIFSITIACERLAEQARAGQFLHIKCGEELLLRRPFGICKVYGNALDIVFEVKGEGTRWLSMQKPGDSLDIIGPLGNGFSLPEGNIIAVGGGMGTPPIYFAAESAKGCVTAVLGFRERSRVIMTQSFEEICDEVYITTDDGSFGIHGQVIIPLEELLRKGGYEAVVTCGQRSMMHAVAKLCKQYGVPCQVSMEERMGCGVGACLVCACATSKDGKDRMSHVCIDGPVFNANEVIW